MQLLADVSSMFESADIAQEYYLVCFFCLGFFIFRTETARRVLSLGGGRPLKGTGCIVTSDQGVTTTAEELRTSFEHRHYDQVLEAWGVLREYTGEALVLVVRALLAVGRAEDIGLFVAKATANLPHLRSSLYDVIDAVASAPTDVAPPASVLEALGQLAEKARSLLDARATQALVAALARFNDEKHVNLLVGDAAVEGATSAGTLAGGASAFASRGAVDAAFALLKRLLGTTVPAAALAAAREATLAVVREAIFESKTEAATNHPGAGAGRLLGLLDIVDCGTAVGAPIKGGPVPAEALVLLLEALVRCMPSEGAALEAVARCERLLRSLLGAGQSLPTGALEALVRAHAGATSEEHRAKAVACFDELVAMLLSSSARGPSEGCLVGLLTACASGENAKLAEHILTWARSHGRCTVPVLAATLKVLAEAQLVDRVCDAYEATAAAAAGLELDTALYGLVIRCAVQAGRVELARRLYGRARNPDGHNTVSMIRAYGQEGNVAQALQVLKELHGRGEADIAAFNAALDVAVSGGDRQAVSTLFAEMKALDKVDVVSFNILLKQHAGPSGSLEASAAIVADMEAHGLLPNVSTYNALLGGAIASGDNQRVWELVRRMEEGPGIDAFTLTILFKGYKGRRCAVGASALDGALRLLSKHQVRVDEVLVNVALEACVSFRDSNRTWNALEAIKKTGWMLPKQCAMHTYATLIKAYGTTRQLNVAWKLWEDLHTKGLVPSEQVYGQMIDVLVSNGRVPEAVARLEEMKAAHGSKTLNTQGFAMAFAMVIRGYAQQRESNLALACYDEMKENQVSIGLVVFNTLFDACSRVGAMETAATLFKDMRQAECAPDIITYSTLIKGYCTLGDMDRALELFARMQDKDIQPDAIVFNSLLDGCAKKQMPKMCEQVLQDMARAGIDPSNHSVSILIKLHGRCRDVEAAFRVFEELPRKYRFRANAAVYTCLMSTCIGNGRLDRALDLRERMVQEGERPDEKTYSTLLRGAVRANSPEACASLLEAALTQPGSARHLLDEELVRSAMTALQRGRGWEREAEELKARLLAAGLTLCGDGAGAGVDRRRGVQNRRPYQR